MLKRNFVSIWPALVTVTAFIILCKLGFWQLDRAQQKREFLQAFASQGNVELSAIVDASESDELKAFNGSLISIKGEVLMPYVFYVDNKIYQGKAGYSVMVPVQISGSHIVLLVDLGWVQAPISRQSLPQLDLPENLQFVGQLKTKQLQQFTLQQQTLSDAWPQRIQSAHSALQLAVPFTILPLIVYAPSDTVTGLVQTYKPVVMQPEKHQAYAVQWFLLALASLVVFYFAAFKPSSKRYADGVDK